MEPKEYEGQEPAWCPGCGNFGIRNALMRALSELDIQPHQFIAVSGIGQSGKTPHYVRCNAFNGLHGRTLPVATGVKLANHEILVTAFAGDGDCYGEGGNHLVHAIRRNIGVKLFVHDNQIYGLTKGQASPTSMEGMATKTQPFGVYTERLDPLAMAVALDCGFVARGYAGDQDNLVETMKEAIRHDGFSLLDILQPCVSFNKLNTFQWYNERVYPLEEGSHDPRDRQAALELATEFGERIPLGVIYRNDRRSYESRNPVLEDGPLVSETVVDFEKIEATLEEFH